MRTLFKPLLSGCMALWSGAAGATALGFGSASAVGQMAQITRVGGGLSSFDGVDAYGGTSAGKPHDPVAITGYRGGVAVGSTALSGDALNFLTIASSFSAPADRLRIEVTATGPASLSLDNLALTEGAAATVPLPASVLPPGAGLLGFGTLRRERG